MKVLSDFAWQETLLKIACSYKLWLSSSVLKPVEECL